MDIDEAGVREVFSDATLVSKRLAHFGGGFVDVVSPLLKSGSMVEGTIVCAGSHVDINIFEPSVIRLQVAIIDVRIFPDGSNQEYSLENFAKQGRIARHATNRMTKVYQIKAVTSKGPFRLEIGNRKSKILRNPATRSVRSFFSMHFGRRLLPFRLNQ